MFSFEFLTLVNQCFFDNRYQPAFIIIDVKEIKARHNETGSNMMEK
jgi:hypothetical protein